VIQEEVKTPLGEELLFGKLEKGGNVVVDAEDAEIEAKDQGGDTGEKTKGKKLVFRCTSAA
jgi:ATP-dependent Clp protease ATP-binding subunit ClpA